VLTCAWAKIALTLKIITIAGINTRPAMAKILKGFDFIKLFSPY